VTAAVAPSALTAVAADSDVRYVSEVIAPQLEGAGASGASTASTAASAR